MIRVGNCLELMATMEVNSVDSVVTDPPYGLSFMGKAWDHGVPGELFWVEALRVAKPGAHLLAFGGARTFHRLMVAIEDAGWEIRDTVMWVYAQGFPKSLDVSKAIDKAVGAEREKVAIGSPVKRMIPGADQDKTGSWIKDNGRIFQPGVEIPATDASRQWQGWGTALKPAWEPIIVARKPLIGTVARNVQEHGTGGLNIDGCRVSVDPGGADDSRLGWQGKWTTTEQQRIFGNGNGIPRGTVESSHLGRFPANLIHDGSDEVLAGFPDSKGQQGDVRGTEPSYTGDENTNCYGEFARVPSPKRSDSGSASRFFYCAKASKSDRTMNGQVENKHPTVKPNSLMRYLCRLVTQPGGLVMDPFCGSGSTGVAAVQEGFRFIGIERDEDSATTARDRIRIATEADDMPLFRGT